MENEEMICVLDEVINLWTWLHILIEKKKLLKEHFPNNFEDEGEMNLREKGSHPIPIEFS